MPHEGGIVTVVIEAATNRAGPELSSSEPSQGYCKVYHIRPKTILDRGLKIYSLGSAVWFLYDCLTSRNPAMCS